MRGSKRCTLSLPLLLAIAAPGARAQAPAPDPSGTAVRRPAAVTQLPRLTLSSPGATRPTDLVLPSGVVIAGRHVSWSQATTLHSSDAMAVEDGRCVFDLSYEVANTGLTATPPFENWVRATPAVVASAMRGAPAGPLSDQPATKTALALGPRESKLVRTKVVASTGAWVLVVHADATGAVPEADKLNNERWIRLTVTGACGAAPHNEPHYLSTHAVLAHVRLAGIEPPSSLPLELDAGNAKAYQDGKCLFDVSYEVRNDGPAATTAFHSSVSVVGAGYQEPSLPPLAPDQVVSVKLLSAFRPGENHVAIVAFNHLQFALATDQNYWHRAVFVQGTCTRRTGVHRDARPAPAE